MCEIILALRVNGNHDVEQDDLVWVQFRFSLILHDEVGQERSSSYCIKVIRAIMN